MTTSPSQANGSDKRTLSARSLPRSVRALLSSDLISRLDFATKHDLQYDGVRNLTTALGRADKLTIADYRARYDRGGIAVPIIEAYPDATWTPGASIHENPDPNIQTQFEKEVDSLFDRLDMWSRFRRADILAGLGRYSVLLIGDGGALENELARMSSPDQIIFVTPLAEDNAAIGELDIDPTSTRFLLPKTYRIKLTSDGKSQLTQDAHWSRVIHIAEGILESDLYGKPRLQAVWDYLDDLIKVVGGGAEAAFSRADSGMQFDYSPQDPDTQLTDAQLTELKEQIELFRHGLERNLYTRDVDINPLTMPVNNFGPNTKAILELVAGTSKIPVRKLIGSERGELASTQDDDNFNTAAANRRGSFAVPAVNQFLSRLIEYGALARPEEYEIAWPEEEELSELEKADVISRIAAANKNQADSGQPIIISSDEIRDRIFGLEPLEQDAIDTDNTEDELIDKLLEDDEESKDVDDIEDDEDEPSSSSVRTAAYDRRILLVGGPRRGKSTIARRFREQGIPTYCSDPRSLVKDFEEGVVYLPENLDWSAASQYVADNWLTMPGPWCIEGIATARAMRKLVKADKADVLSSVEILVIQNPRTEVEVSEKQNSTAKAVTTVWNEIKDEFPQAKYVDVDPFSAESPVQLAAAARKLPQKYQRFVVGKNKLPRKSGRVPSPIIRAW